MRLAPNWIDATTSLATSLISVRNPAHRYPLYPQIAPYVSAAESTEEIQYPLEVQYDYQKLDRDKFLQEPLAGLERWQSLLPPLAPGLTLGEGGTPLCRGHRVEQWSACDALLIKDESQNPTWSHKDRHTLCTVSAAAAAGVEGVAIASSGNHGASAAAYAARCGLKAIVLCDEATGPAHQQMMLAYGAAVVMMPRDARWPLLGELTRRGWYLLGNTARTHTGHPFGPEGYKTVAYELFVQLGNCVPAAIAVPTAYAELLFGIWKGFCELEAAGLSDTLPVMICVEPAACAPHAAALEMRTPVASVDYGNTIARAIGAKTSGFRGNKVLTSCAGVAWRVHDAELLEAQRVLASDGIWAEVSSCAGFAAVRGLTAQGAVFDGPVVVISTSSGLKGVSVAQASAPGISSADWQEFAQCLWTNFGIASE